MHTMQVIKKVMMGVSAAGLLAGCQGKGDYAGREYAPNMYHSVAYEPLTQITDEKAGRWVNALDNGRGQYFNSIKYNPFHINIREPSSKTLPLQPPHWLPY